ncbi:helix-turn-helix domain-containing protein [Streptomyces sp. NPDC002790]|uniref:PucR family transcriptional regulator n=1 Tax=Streptomyces sp. NPDC002790 TaxID=3154431 RepID=UPI0033178AF7
MALEDNLRTLSDTIRERLPALTDAIQHRLREEVPEYYVRDDPRLAASETESIMSSLRDILDGLTGNREAPATASDATLREARLAAQANLDLHALLHTSRVAQACLWDVFLEVANEHIQDDEERLDMLRRVSKFHFAWNDRVTASIIDTYQKEYSAFYLQGRDRKRRAMVRDILAGLPVDAAALGYQLRGRHLALIAWGGSPEAALKRIATTFGWQVLTVAGSDDTVLAWLGRPGTKSTGDQDVSAVDFGPDTYVACGQYANDVEGFRLSHRQAWQAYRVARISARQVTWYQDVALEALVLRDLTAVSDFVSQELGPLHGTGERARVLRGTLVAYFASGQNAASTATVIGVHERTVAYRLRSIEKWLGVSVSARRDELSVALRLFELLESRPRDAGGETPVALPAAGPLL